MAGQGHHPRSSTPNPGERTSTNEDPPPGRLRFPPPHKPPPATSPSKTSAPGNTTAHAPGDAPTPNLRRLRPRLPIPPQGSAGRAGPPRRRPPNVRLPTPAPGKHRQEASNMLTTPVTRAERATSTDAAGVRSGDGQHPGSALPGKFEIAKQGNVHDTMPGDVARAARAVRPKAPEQGVAGGPGRPHRHAGCGRRA